MDAITQGMIGAIVAVAFAKRQNVRKAIFIGWIGGMLADADMFIHSFNDPLFNVIYHRHFTHALVFAPVGGAVAAMLLWLFLRKQMPFREILAFGILGYATHGLLDACTSYGTYLFWPFSGDRIAWDNVSIIDPVFSVTIGGAILFAGLRKTPWIARIGLAFGLSYLVLGAIARDQAESEIYRIAANRGHTVVRLRTLPSLGNLLLWRGIYESNGEFHVDAVRVGVFRPSRVYPGTVVRKFDIASLVSVPPNSVLHRDIRRFTHFADGFVSAHPTIPNMLADMRYAFLPNRAEPLWGIEINPEKPDSHVVFRYMRRVTGEQVTLFFSMLRGDDRQADQGRVISAGLGSQKTPI